MADPNVPIAFAAGVVSFLSPCVLPLVPGYLSYMSGMSSQQDDAKRTLHPAIAALAFVAGFGIVFVALGASATLLGETLRENRRLLARIGGVFIIVMGLIFMGIIRVPWLYREARFHPTPKAGLWGSVTLGSAFAFGWSPCIGPTMAAALAMAAGSSSIGGPAEGAFLLGVYALGLGLPFVLAGLGISRLTGAVSWLRRHIRAVNLVSGVLLIVVGYLFVTEQLFQLSIWMQRTFTEGGLDFWSEF
jgi:cytochrome c-type biogenesis protein